MPHEKSEVKTTRLTVSLPTDLYQELGVIAKRESRSLGWVIRKAAENFVREDSPLFHQKRFEV